MTDITHILQSHFQLKNREVVREIAATAKFEQVKRGKLVAEVGQQQHSLCILEKGILRGYLITPDGRDITDCFLYRMGDVIIGCNELNTPSLINIETLRDCEIWRIPVPTVQRLMLVYPEVTRIYLAYLANASVRHWELKILMYQCSAMQRYQWFLRTYPDLPKGIRGKHVASYLGMNPVTLSRLKKKLDAAKTVKQGQEEGVWGGVHETATV